MVIVSENTQETQEIGRLLGVALLSEKTARKKALVIALAGGLGSGKTTFVQGLAKGLGIKEKILSPTFVILKRFNIQRRASAKEQSSNFQYFYHLDCYRCAKSKDLLDLDFKEIISEPRNIVVIEWAERVKGILPKGRLNIKFEWQDENKRNLYFSIR